MCPGAAMGAEQLVNAGKKVAVIEYHGGDNYVCSDGTSRLAYYGMSGYPTSWFDGRNPWVWGCQTTMYWWYLDVYNPRMQEVSVHKLHLYIDTLTIDSTNNDRYTAIISITELHKYYKNLKLRVALTESSIPCVWQSQTQLHFVCRKMYPDANGYDIDFTDTNDIQIKFNFNVDTAYNLNNCELVAFLQDSVSKEVVQTAKFKIKNAANGQNSIVEKSKSEFAIYPNPANDYLIIESDLENAKVEIYNLNGVLIYTGIFNNNSKYVNISDYSAGLYFVKIINDKETKTLKFIKN